MADRMFILPNDERGYADYGELYESEVDPDLLDEPGPHTRPLTVEEWTTRTGRTLLPTPERLVERICEQVWDEAGEIADAWWATVEHDAGVRATAKRLVEQMARQCNFFTADRKVAEHTISWDAAGEPLWDGEPMYRRSAEAADG